MQISVTLFRIQPSVGHKALRHASVRAVGGLISAVHYGTVKA